MNQIDIPDYQYYLSCNTERMVRLTFLEKKSYSNRKYRLFRLLFGYSFFKKIEFLLGQGVVQFKPKLAWSISCVPRF